MDSLHIPVDDLLMEIGTANSVPDLAIGQCLIRFKEAGPKLRALLELAAAGDELDEGGRQLLFVGVHILGGHRDPLSFQPMLRLLRRPADEVEWLLGDAITESLPSILVGMFDGDADSLFEMLADTTLDEFIRSAVFNAVTFLTWEKRIPLERTIAFIERFDDERLADAGNYVWYGWQQAVAMLGLRTLLPRVERTWQDGRLPKELVEKDYFLLDLARAEKEPDDIRRFQEVKFAYIEDTLQALYWGNWGASSDTDEDYTLLERREWLPQEPITNPMRDVGRNDPCPCGSGKKAKKCCLAG